MSQQPVEANVVLTANNQQYDNTMQQSAAGTDSLAHSVDSLTVKINNLAKAAGRKLIGVGVADVASITAATVAYGSWEKQMSSLNAQSAVLNKTMAQQQATFSSYANSVNQIRRAYGDSTGSAAQLVQTISKLSDQTTSLNSLANTFEKLGKTTGEAPAALAASMLQLQRTMGTSQQSTEQYANQLAVLQARSNASGQAILEFANSIAPLGRMINVSQTDLMGFSNAFIKAGQDGYQAANAFSQMAQGIAQATASGSPDLAKYANLVGMTVSQFKSLGGTNQILDLFNAINRQGPQAITTLNRMGLDGLRTVRTISAMAAQPGGLSGEIQAARGADSGATTRGSSAAMRDLSTDLSKLRVELQQTAEAFGKNFAPAADIFIKTMTGIASVARMVMDSPLGKMAAIVAAIAAPFVVLAGTILLAAKALATFSAVNLVARSGLVAGFRAGRTGTAVPPAGGGTIGTGLFRAGASAGSFFPRGTGPSAFSRGAGYGMTGLGAASRMYGQAVYGGGINNWANRPKMFSEGSMGGFFGRFGSGATEEGPRPGESPRDFAIRRSTGSAAQTAARDAVQADRAASSLGRVAQEGMNASKGLGALRAGVSSAMISMGRAGVGAASTVGRVGSSAYAGLFGSNPWMLGLTAAMVGIPLAMHFMPKGPAPYSYQDTSATTNPYLQAGGVQVPSASTPIGASTTSAHTAIGALNIRGSDIAAAINPNYKPTASAVKGMTMQQAITRLTPTYANIARSPQALNSLKLDLINQFGASGAQQILSSLASGNGYNIGSFLSGTGTSGTNLNNLGGALAGMSGNAFTTGGVQGYRAEQGSQLQTILGNVGTARGINPFGSEQTKGGVHDPYRSTRIAVNKFLAKQYFGLDLSDKDAEKIQMSGNVTDYVASVMSSVSTSDQAQILSSLGQKTYLTGGKAVSAVVNALVNPAANPSDTSSWQSRVQNITGGGIFLSNAVTAATGPKFGQQNAQYRAVNTILNGLAGTNIPNALKSLSGVRNVIGDDTDPNSVLALAAQAQLQQRFANQQPYLSRTGQFAAQTSLFQGAMSAPMTPTGMQERQQAEQQYAQQVQQQYSYFQSMLLQQREYDVQRGRAEQDYDTQRMYAQSDYSRQRGREEHDFQLQRSRAEYEFNLSMQRNLTDYNLSRERAEQDHGHQVMMMVKQEAESAYDIYQRIQPKQTDSSGYLLVNAQNQLQALRQQERGLSQLRQMGLSKNAIQQLGFNDPNNAQQLTRFAAEAEGDPKLIKQFNDAINKRLKAARGLVTDQSSQDWNEFTYQYKTAQDRAQQDFQKSVKRAHEDFQRQLHQQDVDFGTSLDRQGQDFGISMSRMEDQFNLSMSRSAEDMARTSQEIDGSFTKVLTEAVNKLSGHAQTQAEVVLRQFKDLRRSVNPQAVAIMSDLASIFGVKYTPPSAPGLQTNPTHTHQHNQNNPDLSNASGGVLPGWSPGNDNMSFKGAGMNLNLSGGEAIMRPEWVRMVGGPGAVDAMNQAATRGYAKGGVYRPVNAAVSRGIHDTYTGYPAVDLATPVGTPVYAVSAGTIQRSYDIPGPLSSDSYHNPAYGPYGSYGRVMYLHTDAGPTVIYAHLNQRGFVAGTHVKGGEPIAASGSTGNSSGPHLHFGDSDGNPYEFINGALISHGHIKGSTSMSSSIGVSSHTKVGSILKKLYPGPEKVAAAMSAIHPLQVGQISKVINHFAKDRYQKWAGEGGIYSGAQTIGVGERNDELVLPLNNNGANFLTTLLQKSSAGLGAKNINMTGSTPVIAHTVHNYRVDSRTMFTGPITVQANNPNEFMHKLKARNRTAALSQAALGGQKVS